MTPLAAIMRISADMNRWASCTIIRVRVTPTSAASCRSANPSSPYADDSTRHTAATRAMSASVISSGVIRPSAYEDRALLIRPMPAAVVTTIRAGSAACRRSETVPVPRMCVMARAVNARTTAAATPTSN
ncbi:hypothetical protein SALBM311S_05714 [Streptomyces alboniger]